MGRYTTRDKEFWAEGSGLMPIRLAPAEGKPRYILLDGGVYDFCLDLAGEEMSASEYFSAAWSSDVKNYIAVKGDDAIIHNWSRYTSEKVKLSVLQDKMTSFLRILNSTSYRTSDDVTPFILGLFSQLRNLTLERREPVEALNLLFKLLISIREKDLSQETCDRWKILNVQEPHGFDALLESIRRGVRNITPNLDYILRHGSGPLFETAHREALYFDPQFNLFGEISSKLGYANQPKYSGVHYTPRYLVRSIVENALNSIKLEERPSLTILDPACGSGAFLQEVLKQLREKEYTGRITLKGFDISQMAKQTAYFLLSYESCSQWRGQIDIDIRQQNSLIADWGLNDIILMNPPFLSSELIKDSDTKEQVNNILADLQMKKRPNMAAAFLYKAVQSLNNDGVLGAVLPTSLLLQEQYDPLRESIRAQITLESVAQLGNFVFSEALTDTGFVIGKKSLTEGYTPLNIWCSNREQSAFEAMKGWRKMKYDNTAQRIGDHYNIYTPSHFPLVKSSWKVVPMEDDLLLRKITGKLLNGDLKELSRIFDVRQGVIKGNRELFEIDVEAYSQLPKIEKTLFRPIASSQTISSGHVRLSSYLWFPYHKMGLAIKSEKDFSERYPISFEWLFPHKTALLTRSGVNNWWELTRPRIEVFSSKETLLCSKRSGASHSFAIAPAGYVVEEGNVYLFKNSRYTEEDKYFYLAYFSSSVFQRMLSIYARPLKAGYDLGKVQIKDIPILDVSTENIRMSNAYRELVILGREYAEGYTARRDQFDKYVLSFY